MRRATKRGPGPSHLLITRDYAGNVVGIDPHKQTLTATVADPRGGIVASEHFHVSGDGHRALEAWAKQFGAIARWGVEGASGWRRHTAMFLTGRGYDVRDVCATRTARNDRARQRGKSDTLDSERIAREVLAHPLLPKAFKRAGQDRGPDELHELLALWHNQRQSILKSRQHLVNEADCAARRLVVSPAQPGVIRRKLLGPMAYPDPQGERDKSMLGNRRSRPGVRGDASWDPCDMAKATLLEPQSPEDATFRPSERHSIPAPRSAMPSSAWLSHLRSMELCPVRAIKEMSGAPTSRSDVQQGRTRDQPSGRESRG